MNIPILKTKLNIPQRRSETISRRRILKDIETAEYQKLILISAPAGFGKTTTACQILQEKNCPAAWLSLEKNDNELKRFLTYFFEAIRSVKNDFLPEAEQLLISLNTVGLEYVSSVIINEIFSVPKKFCLVLDDLHLIDNPEIISFIRIFLENCPVNMQLIITTREDPDFPLSKMRVKNELFEVRAEMLKFKSDESKMFFKEIMGLSLNDEQLDNLSKRTEGWVAGLQLSAISLKNHENHAQFIEDFTENNYYIMDYLLEEVLENIEEESREFLLKTSILNSLCGSLCDNILEAENGYSQNMLEKLCNSNVFLFELDNNRKWFRYHHLFSELLKQKALSLSKNTLSIHDDIKIFHKRACLWYRKSGFVSEAVEHAVLAQEFNLAAEIVELEWEKMDRTLQTDRWLSMLKLIPDDLIWQRPVLNTGYVWAKLDIGDFDGIEEMLKRSEQLYDWKKNATDVCERTTDIRVSDELQFENLPATIASAWAYYYASTGNEEKTEFYAKKALEEHHGTNLHRRGIINIMFGFSLWRSGNLKAAYQKINEASQDFIRVNEQYSELSVQVVNAEILLELGNLKASEELCRNSLKKSTGYKLLEMLNASFYLTLSRIAFNKKDLDQSEEHLRKSKEWGKKSALPDWKHKWYAMKSEIESEQGDFDAALKSLRRAEEYFFPNPVPDIWDLRKLKIKNYILNDDIVNAEILTENDAELQRFRKTYSSGRPLSITKNEDLIETLSKRELEILMLISEGLSNKEISERLYLAISTVKGYNQNIFSKLQVKSRGLAVKKAREYGII